MNRANYWKLGAFVVLGVALALVAVTYFGSGLWGRSTVDYQVYFDESVQGLDVGSLVRFRGVTVGQVTRIGVAPDGRRIQVGCSLRSSDLRRQGLATPGPGPARLKQPPGLRAQLSVVGLTGQEIVSLDFFDPASHPVAALPFPTPERTIASTTSTLKQIEDSVVTSTDRLPDLAVAAQGLVDDGRALVSGLAAADLGPHAARTLRRADELLASVQVVARRLAAGGTPETAAHAVGQLDSALTRLDELLEQAGSSRGLLTSARRATDALSDAARGSSAVGRELDDTLREAHTTLAAIRRLADALERNPDMLLKGRPEGAP
ncbi:MAG TPA: MlaD family protein [Polyangiaceae bacterium]|nr:MlaD family protein [Polyangiaceae bacterium]